MRIDFNGLCTQMFFCIILKLTESNSDVTEDFKDTYSFNSYCPS